MSLRLTRPLLVALGLVIVQPDAPSIVADRVMRLGRDAPWRSVTSIAVRFPTYHPQGMVKIGDTFFVSAVEVKIPPSRFPKPVDGHDRDTGQGRGHLFKIDQNGKLLGDLPLGEGTMYHPGGIDYDGTNIWVPVAEYRPDSRSIIYRVDPSRMMATEVFRFADHIGAIVHNTDDHTLHGVSWGSRRFYRWTIGNERAAPASARNPSHYVDYQDCKYVGGRRMLCGGVTEIRQGSRKTSFRLGGIDLV